MKPLRYVLLFVFLSTLFACGNTNDPNNAQDNAFNYTNKQVMMNSCKNSFQRSLKAKSISYPQEGVQVICKCSVEEVFANITERELTLYGDYIVKTNDLPKEYKEKLDNAIGFCYKKTKEMGFKGERTNSP